MKKKQTDSKMASLSSEILHSKSASYTQKRLAESALSQKIPGRETGPEMKELSKQVLDSSKYNSDTKKLAKCVYDQAPDSYE